MLDHSNRASEIQVAQTEGLQVLRLRGGGVKWYMAEPVDGANPHPSNKCEEKEEKSKSEHKLPDNMQHHQMQSQTACICESMRHEHDS